MDKFQIDFYKKEDGSCPVKDFLNSMDKKMRAKVLRLLLLLEQNGSELREPYSKALGNGIFELRIKQGTNITRILYFFVIERKIILTNGFVKKTDKVPQKEIDIARKYREVYLKRGQKYE